MWNAPPRLQAWAPELTAERKSTLGLPEADSALEVRWINKEANGGKQAFADGLREGDVIVAIADKSFHLNTRQFNAHIKLNFKVGETLPLTVLRAGKRINLTIQLVE